MTLISDLKFRLHQSELEATQTASDCSSIYALRQKRFDVLQNFSIVKRYTVLRNSTITLPDSAKKINVVIEE